LLEAGALSRGHVLAPAVRVAMPAETDWRKLAIALRAQNRATRMSEDVPAEYLATLQLVSSNTSISGAAEHYSANVVAIRSALQAIIELGP
jgi:hypothetical protein